MLCACHTRPRRGTSAPSLASLFRPSSRSRVPAGESVAKLKRFHAYSLEEYGLSEADVHAQMQWYYDEFKI